jgi:geranylgeranyl reductase family protein
VRRTEVAIVGGGPAGSSLAWSLVRRGLDVTVLDRAVFPRDKVCAGWITPQVVEALALDLAAYARRHVLQPIHSFRVGVIGGPEVETRRSATPLSYGIRRCEFDHHLLSRSGARLLLGEPLRELRREGPGWRINGDLEARLVVGAGGHFCPVARALAAPGRVRETVVVAQEIEFRLDERQREACAAAGEVPRLGFCPDLRGYGWVFRKGDWINVGLGREDPRRLSEHVSAYREALVRGGILPRDTPTRFHGHAYLLYGRAARPLHGDGVLVVGDAAGLAYPRSGEGIRPAVESGLLAAEVIAEARGDYRAARLGCFAERLGRRLGPARSRVGTVWIVPPVVKRAAARALIAREWFARSVVLDRWFLHRGEPALARRAS